MLKTGKLAVIASRIIYQDENTLVCEKHFDRKHQRYVAAHESTTQRAS